MEYMSGGATKKRVENHCCPNVNFVNARKMSNDKGFGFKMAFFDLNLRLLERHTSHHT